MENFNKKHLRYIIIFLVTFIFAVFLFFAINNSYKKGAGEAEYLTLLNIAEQVYIANDSYFEDNGAYANDLNDLIPDYFKNHPKRSSFEEIHINNDNTITLKGIKNREVCNEVDTQSNVNLVIERTIVKENYTKIIANCL